MTPETPAQPPAAPETDVRLADLVSVALIDATRRVDDYSHRSVAEHVARAVEGDRDEVRRELADLRGKVAALLPTECWVTRHDFMRCTDMIGGGFKGGAKWTEGMCCLPCRLRALLAGGEER